MAALNQRWLGRADGAHYRWFGAGLGTVGLGWMFMGVWSIAH
jgi:hypothetical protein